MPVNIGAFSNDGLRSLHSALLEAFVKDEAAPGDKKPYGVRQTGDWKEWSDALESELQKRHMSFTKVPW